MATRKKREKSPRKVKASSDLPELSDEESEEIESKIKKTIIDDDVTETKRTRSRTAQKAATPKKNKDPPAGAHSSKEEDESSDDSDEDSSFGGMSLDVLAMVATDRLESEPSRPKSRMPKKLSKRSLQNMELLEFEQIISLSDKLLVNLFGDLVSNEMTRNYSYTCILMPDQCQQTFASFGNESKARDLVKTHLINHIDHLKKRAKESDGMFEFRAETASARKRRLAEKCGRRRKFIPPVTKKIPGKIQKPGKKYTTVRQKDGMSKRKDLSYMEMERHPQKKMKAGSYSTAKASSPEYEEADTGGRVIVESVVPMDQMSSDTRITGDIDDDGNMTMDVNRRMKSVDAGVRPSFSGGKMVKSQAKKTMQIKVVDDLLIKQPFMDHCYTTVFGPRSLYASYELMTVDDKDRELISARTEGSKFNHINDACDVGEGKESDRALMLRVASSGTTPTTKLHIPIVRVEVTNSDDSALVGAEEVVVPEIKGLQNIPEREEKKTIVSQRPYPPMPKSELAQRGRVPVPEEDFSTSEEEDNLPHNSAQVIPTSSRKKKRPCEGTAEWERKMALKCIRELRCRKRESSLLICKICRNKTFTATATLMYHYRSHAGIKPFVCLICNTTFTRQHSLNYHMLIHNNQSRFTCIDCGRKFRHPSHFKEHLRRHTGETPFHCADCPLRFKTRNTYKRHLKTRHGKLLTANGIKILPREEFLKLHAKYQKKGYPDEFDEDDDEDDDEYDDEDFADEEESVLDHGGRTIPADSSSAAAAAAAAMLDTNSETSSTSTADDIDLIQSGGNSNQESSDAISADMPATNKLLQFCSQVVSQEAG